VDYFCEIHKQQQKSKPVANRLKFPLNELHVHELHWKRPGRSAKQKIKKYQLVPFQKELIKQLIFSRSSPCFIKGAKEMICQLIQHYCNCTEAGKGIL